MNSCVVRVWCTAPGRLGYEETTYFLARWPNYGLSVKQDLLRRAYFRLDPLAITNSGEPCWNAHHEAAVEDMVETLRELEPGEEIVYRSCWKDALAEEYWPNLPPPPPPPPPPPQSNCAIL